MTRYNIKLVLVVFPTLAIAKKKGTAFYKSFGRSWFLAAIDHIFNYVYTATQLFWCASLPTPHHLHIFVRSMACEFLHYTKDIQKVHCTLRSAIYKLCHHDQISNSYAHSVTTKTINFYWRRPEATRSWTIPLSKLLDWSSDSIIWKSIVASGCSGACTWVCGIMSAYFRHREWSSLRSFKIWDNALDCLTSMYSYQSWYPMYSMTDMPVP